MEFFTKQGTEYPNVHTLETWARERIEETPTLFLGHWIDEEGRYCVDTLCLACKAEHGQAYGETLFKLNPVTSEDACSYCGFPEIERPATLQEFCNLYSESDL